ncbi:MAG TPA: amino acid ABC transporter substrate-binding protein [Candidatus Dorea intestinavium]|nr:amino acid ABC transporter substrate-binding protein [Candidatus Dorea intestinavium]
MKKKLAVILTIIMAVSMLAACGGKDKEKEFVVGFDASFPPFGYKDEAGEYVGFDLDLAEEVCKRNDWTLKKQPIEWDSKDMEINSGTIDCIWNGFTINGREDDYTWTKPYINNKQVIVTMKDANITSFADLAGKIVETQTDSSALHALNEDQKALKDSFAKLTEVPEYNTAFMDLESGACEAIALDIGVAYHQVNTRGADKFTILDEEISSEQYGIGFKKGNDELRDQVQKTLDEMAEDGTLLKIAEKYEDSGIPGALALGK